MTRVWWRIVFLLSLFNIVLFVFHFAVLFLSPDQEQCDAQVLTNSNQNGKEEFKATNLQTSTFGDTSFLRMGRSGSAKYFDKEKFTIMILAHGRTSVLITLLQRYVKAVAIGKLPQLSKILVVWNNVHTQPPTKKWESLGPHAIPVLFLKQKENRLTNRFRVFHEIETEAIFTQDDDIYASPLDLKFAFNVFKKVPEKLIGFYARKHAQRTDGFYLYSSNPRHNIYSMILTGACFIHVKFLELFQNQPQVILNKIDELMNGEDIAMNMMISNYTKDVAGYYVKPVFLGTIKSILESGETLHGNTDHIMKRSRCMNEMAKFYGMSLLFTDITFQQYLYTWKNPASSTKSKTKSPSPTAKTKKLKNKKELL